MDQAIRNLLQGATQDARTLLEREVFAQLESIYDILPSGVIAKKPGPHLNATGRLVRMKVVEAIQHRIAGGKEPAEAVDDYAREAAFTCLNRFVALKMLEARELVQVCVSKGDQSGGFREFCGLAPGLSELPDGGYQLYLECLFDELSTEVKVLFDRRDPASLIWPRRPALLGLLQILNQPELAGVWIEDETIGWVYQYFNKSEERKLMREQSSAPRNSRELAVRNQFFTPRYVVQFLTDNTLGRIWYEMRKGSTSLVEKCQYLIRHPNEVFLGPAQHPTDDDSESYKTQNPNQAVSLNKANLIDHRPKKDPRDLKILDPACGSGHFLLYAFDLLVTIYQEAWCDDAGTVSEVANNTLREAYPSLDQLRSALPSLVLSYNLHGIDIDHRAAQIAALALWMRGQRAYSDASITREQRQAIGKSNIVCAEPMPGEHSFLAEFVAEHLSASPEDKVLGQLLCHVFDAMKLAGEAGSLLKIEDEISIAVEEAKKKWGSAPKREQLCLFGPDASSPRQLELGVDVSGITDGGFWRGAEERIYTALRAYSERAVNDGGYQRQLFAGDAAQGFAFIDLCRQRYDVVLMNPPFGDGSIPSKSYIDVTYGDTKGDIYKAFVECFQARLIPAGYLGVISSRTGFFLGQSEDWRTRVVLRLMRPIVLADLGMGVLDAMVEVAAYVLRNLSDIEARDLTLSLVPVLKGVEVDSQKRFSLPKWQAARDGLKRHQAVAELQHLEVAGFVQRSAGEIIRYIPLWEAIKTATQPRKPAFPSLVCVRALAAENKDEIIRACVRNLSGHGCFVCNPGEFSAIPSTPFAYWSSTRLLKLPRLFPTYEPTTGEVKVGVQTCDDFRFVRVWWETQLDPARWFPHLKGDTSSAFYADSECVLNWGDDGKELKAFVSRVDGDGHWSRYIRSPDAFFQPGISWAVRTAKFSPSCVPAGCIPSVSRYLAFTHNYNLLAVVAVWNSVVSDWLCKLRMERHGHPKFIVGVVKSTPFPKLVTADEQTLTDLALQAWKAKRDLEASNLTSHAFILPAILATQGSTLADRAAKWSASVRASENTVAGILSEIDDLVFRLYDLDDADRAALLASHTTESFPKDSTTDGGCDETDSVAVADVYSLVADLLDYAVGVAFGRWDIRFVTQQEPDLTIPGPFDSLPVCPPGQLQNEQGLPITKNEAELHWSEEPHGKYPLDIPWNGILVDDPGHSLDLETRIQQHLQSIWQEHWESIDREACEILGVPTLRSYLRKPSGLFAFHLKRYSKSRRKAPIYWEIAIPSHGYAIWLYYQRFTRDTFYNVLNDFVKPKLSYEEQKLVRMRGEYGAKYTRAQVKALEVQERFVTELANFRDEVERITPLWNPNLNDGVLINCAPLWRLVPQHKAWQEDCKECWDAIADGKYDWSHLAMHLWPERVIRKCLEDRSLAIAHGLNDAFWKQDADGKWKPRDDVAQTQVDDMISQRHKPAVKAALESLLSAPSPGSIPKGRRRSSKR